MAGRKNPFAAPQLALNRIYTRQGDTGQTRLAGGQSVPKDSPRIECFGSVDELGASVGVAAATAGQVGSENPELEQLAGALRRVQHELFNLGSILATLPADVHPDQPRITAAEIERLERDIDRANETLSPLRSFVLAGGSRLSAELHVCRTVCRRAERRAVALSRSEQIPAEAIRYLNRLSDALFVWSRIANRVLGVAEVLWDPNQAASGDE